MSKISPKLISIVCLSIVFFFLFISMALTGDYLRKMEKTGIKSDLKRVYKKWFSSVDANLTFTLFLLVVEVIAVISTCLEIKGFIKMAITISLIIILFIRFLTCIVLVSEKKYTKYYKDLYDNKIGYFDGVYLDYVKAFNTLYTYEIVAIVFITLFGICGIFFYAIMKKPAAMTKITQKAKG